MTEKQMRILSVVATLAAVGMYVSYIPQIQNNLAGNPGSPLQPLVAAINCTRLSLVFKEVFRRPVQHKNAKGRLKKNARNINSRNFSGGLYRKAYGTNAASVFSDDL